MPIWASVCPCIFAPKNDTEVCFTVKKAISLFLCAILILGCLSACGGAGGNPAAERGRLQIVTTIFPIYDWVMNVLGDSASEVEVTMLLDSGVDLHSFQPSAADILKISTCDLFVYVGGESDAWVDGALKEAVNKNMVVVNLLDTLGDAVKEEEVVGGREAEEEEDEGEEEAEYDEHIWLSLRSAAALTDSISKALETVDSAHADACKANAAAYIAKLNALDAQYKAAVDGANVKTLLFGDRFPFRYLVDDYGLRYYAAFVGCSAETEASFETITFLAGKVDELSLPAVCTIEGTDHRIAETVVGNTQAKSQRILTLDSMQSTTAKDVAAGVTYLSVMERNLSVLKEALGG